jgi:hypothetical protein
MKHTIDELLDIVYRYYPRGIQHDNPRLEQTEEHKRLVAARIEAAKDERWRALLDRVSDRCPGMVTNHSLHLPTGQHDGCYSFMLSLPGAEGRRDLWFHISFLAPYYMVHSWRLSVDEAQTAIFRAKPLSSISVEVHGLHFSLPASAVDPKLLAELEEESKQLPPIERTDVSFDLLPDEESYAEWISRDIEATFGCERMPPEVGTVRVPGVTADSGIHGEARIYDCLFSTHHEWVSTDPEEKRKWISVDARRMPASFHRAADVMTAYFLVMVTLMGERSRSAFVHVETDGVVRRDETLQAIAEIRARFASAEGSPAMVALREYEALLTAWDGKGDLPDAMLAWASGVLKTL